MTEEQQNIVDIGANADMNSRANPLKQMSTLLSRAKNDQLSNVSNIEQEAKLQQLEQQNMELAKLLQDEKRRSNDPKSKFERFKNRASGTINMDLSQPPSHEEEHKEHHEDHEHEAEHEHEIYHEDVAKPVAEHEHEALEHQEEHEHNGKKEFLKAFKHDADSDDDEVHDADSDDDEELGISKFGGHNLEDSRRRRVQKYDDIRHRPVSLDDDVPEKEFKVNRIEGEDLHHKKVIDDESDFMMSSYDHQLISHKPTASFNMTPPEELGKTDATNLYAGLIHLMIILAVIYMVTSYKKAIKYSEELKARVEKMIAERKLGISKKEDDIAYGSADLEDKSEDINDEDVETDKQELVDLDE